MKHNEYNKVYHKSIQASQNNKFNVCKRSGTSSNGRLKMQSTENTWHRNRNCRTNWATHFPSDAELAESQFPPVVVQGCPLSNLFDCRAKCTNFKQVGGQTTERRHQDAEGVEGGREWGGDVPLPNRLGGLGKRCKLLQLGLGQSPGRKRDGVF